MNKKPNTPYHNQQDTDRDPQVLVCAYVGL